MLASHSKSLLLLAELSYSRKFLEKASPRSLDRSSTSQHTLPSRSSREAPPPVLTWLSLDSSPNCATTVAVSPPPTMTVAPFWTASSVAFKSSFEPSAKAGNSKTPAGLEIVESSTSSSWYIAHPFQRIVFDSRTVSRKSFRLSGPASRPIQPSGMPSLSVALPVW
jgi:hypothetical protein